MPKTATTESVLNMLATNDLDGWEKSLMILALPASDRQRVVDLLLEVFAQPLEALTEERVIPATLLSIVGLCRLIKNNKQSRKIKKITEPLYARALLIIQHLYEHHDPTEDYLIALSQRPVPYTSEDPLWIAHLSGQEAVQDVLTNTLLVWANQGLIRLGRFFKTSVTDLIEWNEVTIYSLNEKCWNKKQGYYQNYNITKKENYPVNHIVGMLPLVATIATQEQGEDILKNLLHPRYLGLPATPFSFCAAWSGPQTTSKLGPVFPAFNWLLATGLFNYDFVVTASEVKTDTLELMEENGFLNRFSAISNTATKTVARQEAMITKMVFILLKNEIEF